MPENEFEKQVQERMAELRLRPDASVWENIEAELRGKKRRRVLVYICLLAGLLLLGYSGYFLTSSHGNKPVVHQKSTGPSETSSPGSSTLPSQTGHEVVSSPAEKSDRISRKESTPGDETTSSVAPAVKSSSEKDNTSNESITRTRVNAPAARSEKNSAGKPVRKKTSVAESSLAGNTTVSTAVVSPANKQQNSNEPQLQQQKVPIDTPSVALASPAPINENNPEEEVKNSTADTAADLTSIVAPADSSTQAAGGKKNKKVKWAADMSAGASSNNSGSVFGNGLAFADAAPPPLTSTPGAGGAPSPVVMPRSDIKAGPSFRIGILAEMQLTKKSSIASGLQYVYMSNKLKVGSYNPGQNMFNNYAMQQVSVSGIYGGTHTQDFTNRYHFIQIPLQYRLQLGTGKGAPLSLNAGLSASYLVASNALVYSSSQGGIYYHDMDAFNRFHLNFNTGFSLLFGGNRRWQWSIGPELSFDLTRIAKEAYDQKQHLFYGGLGARIYLPSAKK